MKIDPAVAIAILGSSFHEELQKLGASSSFEAGLLEELSKEASMIKEAPFKSKAQQRFMFLRHPAIAKRWAGETKDFKGLPNHVQDLKDADEKNSGEKVALSYERIVEAIQKRLAGKGVTRESLRNMLQGIKGNLKPKTVAHGLAAREVKTTNKLFPAKKTAHVMEGDHKILPREGKLQQPAPGETLENAQKKDPNEDRRFWKRVGMVADDVAMAGVNVFKRWRGEGL